MAVVCVKGGVGEVACNVAFVGVEGREGGLHVMWLLCVLRGGGLHVMWALCVLSGGKGGLHVYVGVGSMTETRVCMG